VPCPLRAPQLRLASEAGSPEDGVRATGAHSSGEGVQQLPSWQVVSHTIPGTSKIAGQDCSRAHPRRCVWPHHTCNPSGNKQFLLLVDDLSQYMCLQLLSCKDQSPSEIKNFHAAVEVETGKRLKVLRTYQGGNSCLWNLGSTIPRTASTASSLPLFTTIEWGGGVAQPERGHHGVVHAQGERAP
jgi:hypothetical protein